MDLSRLNSHGDAPERAFEAFTGILFERWSQREYNSSLAQVVFVNGAGGDGGVEAYALLQNDDLIGLQAKWFKDPLQDSQINQIRSSLDTAVSVRPKLTRYIVTIPRDLSDVRRQGKTVNTERDRWNNFVTQANQRHPHIAIDLWGETKLTSLLAELGSEGLSRYWFENSVINLKFLQLKFEQAKLGWLLNRYYPPQHQYGQIQDDLNLRLNGTGSFEKKCLREAEKALVLLKKSLSDIKRLERYPKVTDEPEASKILSSVQEFLTTAIAEQEEVIQLLSAPYSFPINFKNHSLDYRDYSVSISELFRPIDRDDPDSPEKVNSTKEISERLEQAIESFNGGRGITLLRLQNLGYPVIYSGEAGIGKTHALANQVQQHLEEGKPAILIRARDINLKDSWDKIIADAVGEQSWNLQQICDALSATAVNSEIRGASSELLPVRVLIAIDGLDESVRAIEWAQKIREVIPISKKYPRLLFAFSLRNSLLQQFYQQFIKLDLERLYVRGSDAPVDKIFRAYCQLNRIQCPALVRWALRTPFAIQLFAEIYKGQIIERVILEEFSLVKLINKKIDRIEEEFRSRNGLQAGISPVRNCLRAIAKNCLSRVDGIPEEEILTIVDCAQTPSGILSRYQLLDILNQCSDRGLLLKQPQYDREDPLAGETYTWQLTNQNITDFLLAYEAFQVIKSNPEEHLDLPSYLEQRSDTIVIAINLLNENKAGFDFYNSKLWSNSIKGRQRELIQITVISTISTQYSANYHNWVKELFVRDMPTCQAILTILIEPSLRLPNHPYGAKFVHETLIPFVVAERDLFWSGLHDIPYNHGAKWEGTFMNPILKTLEIADDDEWDSTPLLLAWATTTVDNNNRRRIRALLAKWGSNNPLQLLNLLKETLQTNDPQMREDLMLSAYGAACLIRPDEKWMDLCNWIVDFFFIPARIDNARNAVIRHCASSIIDRCYLCGVAITQKQLDDIRNFTIDPDELLALDRDAALNVDEFGGYEPIDSDLAWYVVPNAVEPFFDSIKDFVFNRELSELTKIFIDKHATAYQLPDLDARKLTFAFVSEYINKLGWTEEIFRGDPRGGKAGEVIGADIAIRRKHWPATHGERSELSTFAEKYVWLATHELVGILATLLPAYDDNDRPFDRPVALSLLTEISNPATDLRQPEVEECESWQFPFPDLSPDCELSSNLQIDLANEWVTKAPIPSIQSLIQIDTSYLPDWAKEHQWLTLKSFAISKNENSQSISVLRISSFTMAARSLSMLKTGKITSYQWHDIHSFKGIIRTTECYLDPSEVVWADWHKDIEGDRQLIIEDRQGVAKKISTKATSCEFHWHDFEGETNELIPADRLRQYLKVIDFSQGKFINRDGDIVAFSLRQRIEHEDNFHVLAVRQDLMDKYLNQNKLKMAWGLWLFREPSTPFAILSESGQRMSRHYKAIVTRSKTGIEVIHDMDIIEPWC